MAYYDNWRCPPCGRPPYPGPGGAGPVRPPYPGPGAPWHGGSPYPDPWESPHRPNRGQGNCPPGGGPFCGGLRGTEMENGADGGAGDGITDEKADQTEMDDMYLMDRIEPEQMEEDWLYMKQLYPNIARKLLGYIEDAADRLEYENSVMFDRYPDRIAVEQIVRTIIVTVEENEPALLQKTESEKITEQDADQTWSSCMEEMIQIMLLGEMHHRRWRYQNMRRRDY